MKSLVCSVFIDFIPDIYIRMVHIHLYRGVHLAKCVCLFVCPSLCLKAVSIVRDTKLDINASELCYANTWHTIYSTLITRHIIKKNNQVFYLHRTCNIYYMYLSAVRLDKDHRSYTSELYSKFSTALPIRSFHGICCWESYCVYNWRFF